jgi:hypothetical protein
MLTPSRAEDKNEELYLLSPLAPAWRETGQLFIRKDLHLYLLFTMYETKYEKARTQKKRLGSTAV